MKKDLRDGWLHRLVTERLRTILKFIEKDPSTPLKINMEPKNGGLEDEIPFQLGHF